MQNLPVTVSLEEMIKSGVHFGHHTSKWHPKMKDFIFGSRNSIHIINLETTKEKLEEALQFIHTVVSSGDDVLFVTTKKQAIPIVMETAIATDMPYIIRRWVGGIFTNLKPIVKRIRQLTILEEKLAEGSLQSYTKKERKVFGDKVEKGNKLFAGLKSFKKLPGAIIVEDVIKDHLAIKEAHDLGVKVIALTDTNVNPELVDYPIPANDDAISSIRYIYDLMKATILDAKNSRPVATESLEKAK